MSFVSASRRPSVEKCFNAGHYVLHGSENGSSDGRLFVRRRLRRRLIDMMDAPRYRDAAARKRAGISTAGGVARATALVEIALK